MNIFFLLLHKELNNNMLCNSCYQQVFVSMSHLFSPYIKGCYHSHWLVGYSYKKLSLLNATYGVRSGIPAAVK